PFLDDEPLAGILRARVALLERFREPLVGRITERLRMRESTAAHHAVVENVTLRDLGSPGDPNCLVSELGTASTHDAVDREIPNVQHISCRPIHGAAVRSRDAVAE